MLIRILNEPDAKRSRSQIESIAQHLHKFAMMEQLCKSEVVLNKIANVSEIHDVQK